MRSSRAKGRERGVCFGVMLAPRTNFFFYVHLIPRMARIGAHLKALESSALPKAQLARRLFKHRLRAYQPPAGRSTTCRSQRGARAVTPISRAKSAKYLLAAVLATKPSPATASGQWEIFRETFRNRK